MPQLDTSTWFLTISLMIISLFCVYQTKMINQTMISITQQNKKDITSQTQLHWEKKWTKIYLPHSSPLLS
ncbi:ATP synthase F0 subunit 8 (mitochondrion) [Trichosurus vulpecula]|uniref:ATP synthase complex subunit 8 n=1 Tax=Trichosurus vulpecula TaxID=9337 RepID=Q952S2_TRIVU|nr:ATP synthase F0 subunit 8 [Trichosurus vulpecula]AAK38693.1 ATPase8 [Trichosurus vulpecula]WAK98940.1 ATP synthase F0 subunit 8 [Trichosurus vulpecula]WAK98953.1 ATP synthase F0 subunit 8 [Trichosurus vulpecula]WAK98966.1 ATP synthase F0 subunit 8 [Trichosurus vulpecula]WAK98979.1 ATP synthase F0 subunit 8 [Trichosurus vulpecula]